MKRLLILLTLVTLSVIRADSPELVGTCHPSCGGNTQYDCTDYKLPSVDSNNCISCAPGYIGGAPDGYACTRGTCNEACVSCSNLTPNSCYLCSPGYFDPTNNPHGATPCVKCHETCFTCADETANGCLICAPGFFDESNNPYYPGSCFPCDESCAMCNGAGSGNCIGGCASGKNFAKGKTQGTCS